MDAFGVINSEAVRRCRRPEINAVWPIYRERFAFIEVKDEPVALGSSAYECMNVVHRTSKPIIKDFQGPERYR